MGQIYWVNTVILSQVRSQFECEQNIAYIMIMPCWFSALCVGGQRYSACGGGCAPTCDDLKPKCTRDCAPGFVCPLILSVGFSTQPNRNAYCFATAALVPSLNLFPCLLYILLCPFLLSQSTIDHSLPIPSNLYNSFCLRGLRHFRFYLTFHSVSACFFTIVLISALNIEQFFAKTSGVFSL